MPKKIEELPKGLMEEYNINIDKKAMHIFNPCYINIQKPYTIQKVGDVSYHIDNDKVCVSLWTKSLIMHITVYD